MIKEIQIIPLSTAATADVTSVSYDLGDITVYSVAVDFTGSNLVGTLTLEASNASDATGFITVTSSSQAITASSDHMWNVTGAGYRWVRVFWDFTSGTGNISAKLTAKPAQ